MNIGKVHMSIRQQLLSLMVFSCTMLSACGGASSGTDAVAGTKSGPMAQTMAGGANGSECKTAFDCAPDLSRPVGKTVHVDNFGASGSIETIKCNVVKGDKTVFCPEVGDFKVGHGIFLKGMGLPPHGAVYPYTPKPQIMKSGTAVGSNKYCYIAIVADPLRGMQVPSEPACLTNQPLVNHDTYHTVWLDRPFHDAVREYERNNNLQPVNLATIVPIYLWYVSVNDGDYEIISVSYTHDTRQQFVHASALRPNGDFGGWPNHLKAKDFPTAGVLQHGDLFTKIKSIQPASGGYQLLLENAPAQTGNSVLVSHDDTDAVQQAINSATKENGNENGFITVQFSAKNYNIQRPSFQMMDSDERYTVDFINTPKNIAWWLFTSMLHLNQNTLGNVKLMGMVGEGNVPKTIIHTGPAMALAPFLDIHNSQTAFVDSLGYISNSTYNIEPANKGSYSIKLKNKSYIDKFLANDDIWLFSGNYHREAPSTGNLCRTTELDDKKQAEGGYTGSCHFSEINTIKSVNKETGELVLKLPLAQKYWADEAGNSFGIIKTEKLPANIAIANIVFDSQRPIFSYGAAFNVMLDNVRVTQVFLGNGLGAGYKRGFTIKNSIWGFGCQSKGWDCVQEFDQINDVIWDNNTITGYAAPGFERSSEAAQIFFSEGSSNIAMTNNIFNNLLLVFQLADEVGFRHNQFNDAVLWVGSTHTFRQTGLEDDWAFKSYASQNKAYILENTFNITDKYESFGIIRVGNFAEATISSNQVNFRSNQPDAWMIQAASGKITDNTFLNTGKEPYIPAVIEIFPDTLPRSFVIENNKSAGNQRYGVYVNKNSNKKTVTSAAGTSDGAVKDVDPDIAKLVCLLDNAFTTSSSQLIKEVSNVSLPACPK